MSAKKQHKESSSDRISPFSVARFSCRVGMDALNKDSDELRALYTLFQAMDSLSSGLLALEQRLLQCDCDCKVE